MNKLEIVNGERLDALLERGYYRIQQTVFTTRFYYDGSDFQIVFWLRTKLLPQFSYQKHPVFKRNKGFNICIKPAEITSEIEELFSAYKTAITFNVSDSVYDYLVGTKQEVLFESYMIAIRDAEKLIAIGYFDKGNMSIMGIMNFYHPDYKKYSLGKYLMLLKIQYAIQNQMKYYYTGYIAITNTLFDYKLFPDIELTEVYLPEEEAWFPYKSLGKYGLLQTLFHKDKLYFEP